MQYFNTNDIYDFPFPYFYEPTVLPVSYSKMEGLLLLKMNKHEESLPCLQFYCTHLIQYLHQPPSASLSSPSPSSLDISLGQLPYSRSLLLEEISSMYLKAKSYEMATDYALQCVKLDKRNISAHRTLVWASMECGKTNREQVRDENYSNIYQPIVLLSIIPDKY